MSKLYLHVHFSFYLNINAQESAEYKEKLEKFQRQNKNIVEEIVEVAKTLVTNNHHCDTGLLYQKEQLEYAAPQIRSEKQQLYQLINILEVNNIKHMYVAIHYRNLNF